MLLKSLPMPIEVIFLSSQMHTEIKCLTFARHKIAFNFVHHIQRE